MTKKTSCVYVHINKINGKKYYGEAKYVFNAYGLVRWGKNGKNYGVRKQGKHFASAISYFGWDNFTHKIIRKNLTKRQAVELESRLIRKYKTTNPDLGYNQITKGSIVVYTDELRKRLSKIGKKRFSNIEERIKQSKRLKGKSRSLESRLKQSKTSKGKVQSKLQNKHISQGQIGLKWYNDGKVSIQARRKPKGFSRGYLVPLDLGKRISEGKAKNKQGIINSSHKGYKWWTNGKVNKRAKIKPKGNWINSKTHRGKK